MLLVLAVKNQDWHHRQYLLFVSLLADNSCQAQVMDSYPMNTTDAHHYSQRQQHWPPHLLAPTHSQASFPSPPASEHGQHYAFFQTQAQAQASQQQQAERVSNDPLQRTTSSLSLNLSSLTVASPTNLSPINPPSASGVAAVAAASALSPVTPISPGTTGHHNPFALHSAHGVHHPHMQSPFSYDPSQTASGQQSPHYDNEQQQPPGSSAGYEHHRRTPAPSRSSSSSTSASQLPRKRSFTANPNPSSTSLASSAGGSGGSGGLSINVNVNPTLLEESMYDDESRDAAMELTSAVDRPGTASGSPVDGSGSTSGAEDSFGMGIMTGVGGTMNILGKPLATNNFVTKLYQWVFCCFLFSFPFGVFLLFLFSLFQGQYWSSVLEPSVVRVAFLSFPDLLHHPLIFTSVVPCPFSSSAPCFLLFLCLGP